jgi:reactive chlorine resistance protein C
MGNQRTKLTELAAWIDDRNIPFLVISIGLIVMLFWAGAYKMTAPGADGIVPLVSNSPLISWHFKLFGPYLGSDLSVLPSGLPRYCLWLAI